jgi:hypothetical protein
MHSSFPSTVVVRSENAVVSRCLQKEPRLALQWEEQTGPLPLPPAGDEFCPPAAPAEGRPGAYTKHAANTVYRPPGQQKA